VNILLLSTGGGGGNILRSVKTLFERELAATDATDPVYASRLRAAISTCFVDTNEFSVRDLPAEERLLIGARTTGRLGARHNPEVAKQALEESKSDVEAVVRRHSVIIVIGTGGKGTGAGTILPLAQIARHHRKLVIPVFVRPSFDRHEVDKRRYDHALAIAHGFDAANIRLIEILNDRGYDDAEPQPQSTVWERMNLPIAHALRGLLYVLWDLSQVDPSDLSTLFAGPGRLRMGFGRLEPANGVDPTDDEIHQAVQECWRNPYYAFSKPVGTSLICIQGDWSNVADAKLKGGLAARAAAGMTGSPYTPLYTRAVQSPKPWGITTLFSEYTGLHTPLDIEWSLDRIPVPAANNDSRDEPLLIAQTQMPSTVAVAAEPDTVARGQDATTSEKPPYATLWEFAVAVNRSEAEALTIARDDEAATGIAFGGLEVKKLLGTVWFRTVVPRLSEHWRTRLFEAFVEDVVVVNHIVKVGRRLMPLGDLTISQVREVATQLSLPGNARHDNVRPDLDLLIMVGRFWGNEALARVRFSDAEAPRESSKLASFLVGLRG
jgi:cell division GTPase FtsZ